MITPSAVMQGWPGLAFGICHRAGTDVLADVRARAPLRTAAAVAAAGGSADRLAGLGVAATSGARGRSASPSGGILQLGAAVACSAALGYVAGRVPWHERQVRRRIHKRGAIVSASPARAPRAPARSTDALAASVRPDHAGRVAGGSRGRDQALQAHRHHRHRQEHGHSRVARRRARSAATGRSLPIRMAAICGASTTRQRGDVILNPFEPRSAKWDLFGEISNDYDVDQLARSLIPGPRGRRIAAGAATHAPSSAAVTGRRTPAG